MKNLISSKLPNNKKEKKELELLEEKYYLDYIGDDGYVYKHNGKEYYRTNISLQGPKGNPGPKGRDGLTPSIGLNGNWYIGGKDTYVKATSCINSTVNELKELIDNNLLVPGAVYSYNIGNDENYVTIYQKAITPNTLDTNGILVSDNDKYNGVDVNFDVTSYPEDSSVLVVMSKDKDNLFVYEDGVLKEVACKVAETANGRLAYNRIPTNHYIPEEFTPGVYLVRIESILEQNENAIAPSYGGLVRLSLENNVAHIETLADDYRRVWTIKENKFTTHSETDSDVANALINDVVRAIYNDRLPDGVTWSDDLLNIQLDEIGPIISIIDPEH